MTGDLLEDVAATIMADPRCSEVDISRQTRQLPYSAGFKGWPGADYHAPQGLHGDSPVLEAIVVTHPSTPAEFFISWQTEGPFRRAVLTPGPYRTELLEQTRQEMSEYEREQGRPWPESYRQYRHEHDNARVYGFHTHGTLNDDLTAGFYAVWIAEPAGLHRDGHDDDGTTRTDGQRAGVCAAFASISVSEVVDWLAKVFHPQSVAPARPRELDDEAARLARWPIVRGDYVSDGWLCVEDDAKQVVARLDPRRLNLAFPRDRRGRLEPRARVLLAPLVDGPERARRAWVVACGPPRVGGNEVTVRVEQLIAAHQPYRFDLAPQCWQTGTGALDAPSTWGYRDEDGDAVELLRQGHIEDGLKTAGLSLDYAVTRLINGLPLGLVNDNPQWPITTRQRLCLLAPWLLLGPGRQYAETLLSRKSEGIRLFSLPRQSYTRKASIVFVPTRRPSLQLRWTGSNAILSKTLWERPPIPGAWR